MAEKAIIAELDEQANIDYKSLEFSIWGRDLEIMDISMTGDDDKDTIIRSNHIHIHGIKLIPYLIQKKVKVGSIEIDTSYINFSHDRLVIEDTTDNKAIIKEIQIGDLNLNNVQVKYTDKSKNLLHIDDLYIQLEDIKLNPSNIDSGTSVDNLNFSWSRMNYNPLKGNYIYQVLNTEYDQDDEKLILNTPAIKPKYSQEKWAAVNPDKGSRLEWKSNHIIINGLNANYAWKTKEILTESVAIEQSDLIVHIKKPKLPCDDCYKAFIHEQLLNLKIPVSVPITHIRESNIELDIIGKEDKDLNVTFDNINGRIKNISNIPQLIKRHAKVTANISAKFMNESPLDVDFTFDLDNKLYGYSYHATLGKMNMLHLNTVFQDEQPIAIASGELQKLKFTVQGDNRGALGTMDMDYKDLKLVAINDEGKKKALATMLLSIITNRDSEGHRKGNMTSERDKAKGLFHQWWITIVSGFKSTILE